MVELSNPSLLGYGIDEAFQESDPMDYDNYCKAGQRRTDKAPEPSGAAGRDQKAPTATKPPDAGRSQHSEGCKGERRPRRQMGEVLSQPFQAMAIPKSHHAARTTLGRRQPQREPWAQGTRTSFPVVLRPSSATWAAAASLSG